MKSHPLLVPVALVSLIATQSCAGATPKPAPATAVVQIQPSLTVPVEYHTLDNGLRVALSPDHSAPVVTVAVYYDVGFRSEPRGRTGFAHLFEHLMFQGSANLGKGEFDQLITGNGGTLNGSTRADFTNYFEIVPAHMLETALWAEADRMRALAIDQERLDNQRDVVINEIKVNVFNRPYGGFPWLDLPMNAFDNWYNNHNSYGELGDIEAATLEAATDFFKSYYRPNNAALALVGDFEPAQALAWVRTYFGGIPAGPEPPRNDISEPRQEKEKRVVKEDRLANRPALAFAYKMPPQRTTAFWAMVLLEGILLSGDDALLYQALVREAGMTGSIQSAVNMDGDPYNGRGPVLWTCTLFHDPEQSAAGILAVVDRVFQGVREAEVDAELLDRAKVKARSAYFTKLEMYSGYGRADILASNALFYDDPTWINRFEGELAKVTVADVKAAAQEYLRVGNRTVVELRPSATEEVAR